MATATLRALAAEWGVSGAASMDHLTKEAGILQVAEAISASHGMSHKHKRLDALPVFTIINPGDSVGDTTVDYDIYTTDLKIVKCNQSEPADIVVDWPAGKAAYFNGQRPAYLEAFGQQLAKIVYYGTNSDFGNVTGFTGLHQLAKAYGNVIQEGGTTGSRNTIFVVKFRSGSNGCGILFDPAISSSGEMMNSEIMLGGMKTFEVTDTSGSLKKTVYWVEHLGKAAFLSTSRYDIAAYTQLEDAGSMRPTAARMDELIDMVRFSGDSTFLFMNRLTRRILQLLKDSKLIIQPGETEYYKWLETWAGVPIIIDGNLVSNETNVLD